MENELRNPEEIGDKETGERSSRLPLILTIVSLLIWFGFQTVQLVMERGSLSLMNRSLEAPMQQSQRVRAQLEALIGKTAELANQGNANARVAIEELEKRGIPIGSPAPPSK